MSPAVPAVPAMTMEEETMEITVNGDAHTVTPPCTVEELLARLGLPCAGVAVAVDGLVLPRSQWGAPVADGAVFEVLTAVQGG